MRKILVLFFLIAFGAMYSQEAYSGKGDRRLGIGLNLQPGAQGIQIGTDKGLGENISYGFAATYMLSVSEIGGVSSNFLDNFDFKCKLNANLCSLIGIEQLDVYPGLNIGLRNFGGHLGVRYFLTDGLGLFAEFYAPFKKFDYYSSTYSNLNNQSTFVIGVSFNFTD